MKSSQYLIFITIGLVEGVSVNQIVDSWLAECNFKDISDYISYIERHDVTVLSSTTKSQKRRNLLYRTDYVDYTFNDKELEDRELPSGEGILLLKQQENSGDWCSQKSVHSAVGIFNDDGCLNGPAIVSFIDGSTIFGNFSCWTLHGFSVEIGSNGNIREIGNYESGKKKGAFWYFESRILLTAITGNVEKGYNGTNFMFVLRTSHLNSDLIIGESENGLYRRAQKCDVRGFKLVNGVMILETEVRKDRFDMMEFRLYQTLSFEDRLLMQAVWYDLKNRPRYKTPFKNASITFKDISSLYDTSEITADLSFMDNTVDFRCKRILKSYILKTDSVRETAVVAALGSGSKWIVSCLDLSMSVQNYPLAGSFFSPYYKKDSAVLIKSHHARLLTNVDARRKEKIEWRMNHMLHFEGRGILLLRNPYEAIISHWNHHMARNEMESIRDINSSINTKEFEKFADNEIELWCQVALDWLAVSPRLLVIHYEDFKDDLIKELSLIHEWLYWPLDEKRMKCLKQFPLENWKRKHNYKILQFPDKLIPKFDESISKVQAILKEKKLRLIPLPKYKYTQLNAL